jgi:hypothetical protein
VTGSDEKGLTLSVVTGVSSQVLRAWLALVLVVELRQPYSPGCPHLPRLVRPGGLPAYAADSADVGEVVNTFVHCLAD